VHSKYRHRLYLEAKSKGRHTGYGKRKGSANARMPVKVVWMRRLRVLRRLLAKYRYVVPRTTTIAQLQRTYAPPSMSGS
jgi:ribosomal protein L19E